MTHAMVHRGPDGDGYFSNPDDGIYFGHRRLAIIDLSSKADQPMWDFSRRYVLIFNGEIYNYKEIREEITGYPFTTQSDAEVILASYIKWGKNCVKKFNGIFSLAIWDTQDKVLFVTRDQIGIKPLYFYRDDEKFIFASEIRGLLASGLIPPALNKKVIPEYLTYQSTLRQHTLLENIYRLEPGYTLCLQRNTIIKEQYWNMLNAEPYRSASAQETKRLIRTRLQEAVHRQMVSDVPIGAFLSGGIDSSAIVSCMAHHSTEPINTFTVTFSEKEFNEASYARKIAQRYNTRHHEVHVQANEVVERIPSILRQMDNPSGDGINTYIVSEAIRNAGLKVVLSGLGGDELFAGYPYFRWYKRIRTHAGLWRHTEPVRQLMSKWNRKVKTSANQKLAEVLDISTADLPHLYPSMRAVYGGAELKRLGCHYPSSNGSYQHELERLNTRLEKFPYLSQFSIGEMLGYTEGVLLKDSDQMSMIHSIELRVPFFDVELVEMALNIPDEFKNPVTPKILLVSSIQDWIPEEVWNRKKMGFTFPWELWLRHELKSFCDEAIHALSQRDLFQTKVIKDYWSRFLKGDRSVSWMRIWLLVVLEKWIENTIES
jgi:asparagine synthase (glutamine-hydrolysing)